MISGHVCVVRYHTVKAQNLSVSNSLITDTNITVQNPDVGSVSMPLTTDQLNVCYMNWKSSISPLTTVSNAGITSSLMSYCWSRPRYESLMTNSVQMTLHGSSGAKKASDADVERLLRVQVIRFIATTSFVSISLRTRIQPSSFGFTKCGAYARLSRRCTHHI